MKAKKEFRKKLQKKNFQKKMKIFIYQKVGAEVRVIIKKII